MIYSAIPTRSRIKTYKGYLYSSFQQAFLNTRQRLNTSYQFSLMSVQWGQMEKNEVLPFDLIIRNGRVINPASGLDIVADIGIKSKRIASIEPDLEGKCIEEYDATGCIVTPGLIDIHVHVYQHATPLGIDVDETCLARGVTTVVDAGSAGMLLCIILQIINDYLDEFFL